MQNAERLKYVQPFEALEQTTSAAPRVMRVDMCVGLPRVALSRRSRSPGRSGEPLLSGADRSPRAGRLLPGIRRTGQALGNITDRPLPRAEVTFLQLGPGQRRLA